MPNWPVRLLSELNAADDRARRVAAGLSCEQLNWQPGIGQWSIGQCLEHLAVGNELYLPAISDALAGRPHRSAPEIAPGWFARWFIRRYIAPSPATKRARAPKAIAPGAAVDPAVLDRFLTSNRHARALVERAAAYDVNRIRFRNPFFPLLRFTVGTGFEILSQHESRHLVQAERIRRALEAA